MLSLDEGMRTGTIQNVYLQWAAKDREQANAALDDLDLSQENITELKGMELLNHSSLLSPFGASIPQAVEGVEEAQ